MFIGTQLLSSERAGRGEFYQLEIPYCYFVPFAGAFLEDWHSGEKKKKRLLSKFHQNWAKL